MTALSHLLPRFFDRPPAPATKEDVAARIRYDWRAEARFDDLTRFLDHCDDFDARRNAVWEYLFNAGKSLADRNYDFIVAVVCEDIERGETIVRNYLRPHEYDTGFLRNIAVWQGHTDLCSREYNELTGHTSLCITRMSAVEKHFHDQISYEAVEVGIAFLVQMLTDYGRDLQISDQAWKHGLIVATQWANRRERKSLTVDELSKLRAAALPQRHHMALEVQKLIPPI